MKSHLATILDRLTKLVQEDDPKATYNFEKDGEVLVTVSYDSSKEIFAMKYPKQKVPVEFDNIDLVVIEVFELVFGE